jgi:hypothetical protein
MPSQNLTYVYLIYFAASIGLTSWLAVVLNRNGKTFLRDVFDDKPDLGDAVNQLLTIGFFMLNLGYAFLILRAQPTATTEETVNFLANRLGLLLVSLGILHFVNMAVFARIRHRVLRGNRPPAPPMAPPPDPRLVPPRPGDRPPARATFVPAGAPAAPPAGPDLPPPPAPGPVAGPWAQPGRP